MRKSNVDISKLPKFNSHEEAVEYFSRYGKLTFFGVELPEFYYVYGFLRNNGVRYDIDIYPDGMVVVTQRGLVGYKNY